MQKSKELRMAKIFPKNKVPRVEGDKRFWLIRFKAYYKSK